jgi:TatD DNase family protein
MFVDAHCHFDQLVRQESKIAECFDLENTIIFANSVDLNSSKIVLGYQHDPRLTKSIIPFVGLHPSNASMFSEVEFLPLFNSVQNIGGIGEIGLDPSYPQPLSLQKRVFEFFLTTAEKLELPVCLHSRNAEDLLISELKSFNMKSVMFHWFSGSEAELRQLFDNNWFVSFGPSILYSKHIQRICMKAPLQSILTETDSPVSYSGSLRSTTTAPYLVPSVILKISQVKGVSFEDATAGVWANAIKFLGTNKFNKFTR